MLIVFSVELLSPRTIRKPEDDLFPVVRGCSSRMFADIITDILLEGFNLFPSCSLIIHFDEKLLIEFCRSQLKHFMVIENPVTFLDNGLKLKSAWLLLLLDLSIYYTECII
jgi:hypothetical protein